jgi:membrane protein DedA with SNARE-associated domain
MITHLIAAITHFIAQTGYPGIFLMMALESACIPIPSEAIMPFAGALIIAPQGSFHPSIVILALVGAFGNLFGSVLAYWVGYVGGRPFLEKYGKYLLIRKRDITGADAFFHKHGEATVFFSRVLPVIRTFISLPAGISRMDFTRFCLYTFAGALPWAYLLAWAGTKYGQHIQRVDAWLHRADDVIILIVIVLFVVWLWHHLRPDSEDAASLPVSSGQGTKSSDGS